MKQNNYTFNQELKQFSKGQSLTRLFTPSKYVDNSSFKYVYCFKFSTWKLLLMDKKRRTVNCNSEECIEINKLWFLAWKIRYFTE